MVELCFECMRYADIRTWMVAEKARSSALIGHLPIRVIPNVLSLQQFTIVDRIDARTAVDADVRYVIAFGAARIDDPIKGFNYLAEALRLLVDSGRFRAEDIRLLLFGRVKDAGVFNQLPVPYTYLGYVDDVYRLSQVYSASNATVSSSLYETFGQTLIEAMACGSIPVSFDGSGQTGIEKRYDEYLCGYDGEILYEADLIGKDISGRTARYVAATDGLNVRLDGIQGDVEHQRSVRLNGIGATLAITKLSRDIKGGLAALAKELETLGPTRDDPVESQHDRIFTFRNFLNHSTILQGKLVVNINSVLRTGLDVTTGLFDKIAKTRLGRLDTWHFLDLVEVLGLLSLVDRSRVSCPLLNEGLHRHVHNLRIDLELLDEVGVTLVPLRVDEIIDTLLDLRLLSI